MRVLRRVANWWWPRFGLPEPGGVTAFHPADTPTGDLWRDAAGVHICLHSRVEQVAVDNNHGALRERLHHRGQVVGRGCHLIYVRLDRGNQLIALRPHHVRVLNPGEIKWRERTDRHGQA